MRIGVIGLGQIGHGVAICLARANALSAIYDVRPEAQGELGAVCQMAVSPAEVASRSDIVIIAVVSSEQARDVLFGSGGLLASAARPRVLLMATISLEDFRNIRRQAGEGGITVTDCGVIGGAVAHLNGLICLVGADDDEMAAVRPALDVFAGNVIHVGPPGTGMAAKICRNVVVYGVWRTAYEAACLADAAGVDVRQLAAAIDASEQVVGGAAQWIKRPDPAGDAAERALREQVLVFLNKDLSAAINLAGEFGLSLPMAELSRETGKSILGL